MLENELKYFKGQRRQYTIKNTSGKEETEAKEELKILKAFQEVANGGNKDKLTALIAIKTALQTIEEQEKLVDERIATIDQLADDSVVYEANGFIGPVGIDTRLLQLRDVKAALDTKRKLSEYALDVLLFGLNMPMPGEIYLPFDNEL